MFQQEMQSLIVFTLTGIGRTKEIKLAGIKQLKDYPLALEQLIQRDVGTLIIQRMEQISNFGNNL